MPREFTRIAVTMGDINGIGPEILAKALADTPWPETLSLVLYGSPEAYADAARLIPGAPALATVTSADQTDAAGHAILSGSVRAPRREPGTLSAEAGRAAMEWLDLAVSDVLAGRCDAVATCPIHKVGIRKAGYTCAGHTDYLAERAGVRDYRMCLFTERIAVVHNTGHLSLREALDWITHDRLVETIRIARDGAYRLLGREPRVAVAGLNPHAGEQGAFGREEIDVVTPAIESARTLGVRCAGPVSPDAVFRQAWLGEYDAVVALYHDQGHIPMKLVAMEQGVNVTLGLPFVRTSVDHGTAYDLAGTGRADAGSLVSAIRMAERLARTQEHTVQCD